MTPTRMTYQPVSDPVTLTTKGETSKHNNAELDIHNPVLQRLDSNAVSKLHFRSYITTEQYRDGRETVNITQVN